MSVYIIMQLEIRTDLLVVSFSFSVTEASIDKNDTYYAKLDANNRVASLSSIQKLCFCCLIKCFAYQLKKYVLL